MRVRVGSVSSHFSRYSHYFRFICWKSFEIGALLRRVKGGGGLSARRRLHGADLTATEDLAALRIVDQVELGSRTWRSSEGKPELLIKLARPDSEHNARKGKRTRPVCAVENRHEWPSGSRNIRQRYAPSRKPGRTLVKGRGSSVGDAYYHFVSICLPQCAALSHRVHCE